MSKKCLKELTNLALNDIQINKEKSELLLRKINKIDVKKTKLLFGDQEIEISPIPFDQSLRILGV
jgi:hypothetical protein